jgi:hypothetical protein
MTGLEWQGCENPRLMVEALRSRCEVSDRKWRLFVAAFWPSRANHLGESREEVIDESAIMEAWAETGRLPRGYRRSKSDEAIFYNEDPFQSVLLTVETPLTWTNGRLEAAKFQANILRDLFGNPFRTLAINYRWRTSDVIDLARAIDADRAFERMPILADALMDAGCEDERLIGHCQANEGHVKGCWALDLLLRPE